MMIEKTMDRKRNNILAAFELQEKSGSRPAEGFPSPRSLVQLILLRKANIHLSSFYTHRVTTLMPTIRRSHRKSS